VIESDDDRLLYVHTVDFGESWIAPTGTLKATFDNDYIESAGEVDVETRTPSLLCRERDAAALDLKKGDALARSGVQYLIRRLEPDGLGMLRLILEK